MSANNWQGNRHFFQSQLRILKYCGLWNPFEVPNVPQYDRVASKRYTITAILLLVVFFYLYLLTEFLYTVKPAGEKDFTKAFFVSATGYKMSIKVYYFLRQRKEYRVLVHEFQHSMALGPQNSEEEKFFSNALALSKDFLSIFLMFGCVACCFWGMMPTYNYLNGLPWTLPIAAWFPYADTYVSIFWTAHVYQMIGTFLAAGMTISLSSFEATFFCYLNACIQILSVRLTKIGQITPDSVTRRSSERPKAYEDILQLVKHHLLVKNYIQHCENLAQVSIFAEISLSSLIICMTTFRIVTHEDTGIEFVSTASYLGGMIIQIFQFCFVGNKITYSSNELGTSAFFSDFRKFDKKTSRLFLILHKNLQREMYVCTGGPLQIKLNIDTFLRVMKTSYSFMAVFKAEDT